MGLAIAALRMLAREHKYKPFTSPILILGRQHVYATREDVEALMESLQLTPHPMRPGESYLTNITGWDEGREKGYISDIRFFKMLAGRHVRVHAMDVSAAEGADIVHNLNLPVPNSLKNKFGFILDGGTIEHVFNAPQALRNVADMLRPGGRVIHISPANQYVNHGFYQFSPTLFFDYYITNQFTGVRGFLASHDPDDIDGGWSCMECIPFTQRMMSEFKVALAVIYFAEKTDASTSDRIPIQSSYVHHDPQAPAEQKVAYVLWQARVAIYNNAFDQAEALLSQIVDAISWDPAPAFYLGCSLFRLGRYSEAEPIMRKLASDLRLPEDVQNICQSYLDRLTGGAPKPDDAG